MLNFGSGLLYLGDKMDFFGKTSFQELTVNDVELPEEMNDIRFEFSDKAELSFECEVNPSMLHKTLGGVDLSPFNGATSYTIEGKMPYWVQARRHKKKRINKKWLKRYGYKTVLKTVRMTEVHFNPGTNEFEGNIFY